MVRVTALLYRVPVIKFRKGGLPGAGKASSSPAAAPAPAATAAAPGTAQPAAAMSSSAISDMDLPLRYQRQPLTQEEIDHINGGGIKNDEPVHFQKKMGRAGAVSIIKLPSVLVGEGNRKEAISLNLIIQKTPKRI